MPSLKDYVTEGLRKGYSENELRANLAQKGYSKKEIDSLFDQPKKTTAQPTKSLGFFERLPHLISNPKFFFANVRDTNIGSSIGAFALAAVIMTVLALMLSFSMGRLLSGNSFMPLYSGYYGIGAAIISIILIFIYASLTHAFAKAFKGTGSYVDTFNAITYPASLSILLTVIPFVGFIAAIYAIVLTIIGLSEYHQISTGKAIAVALLPALIFGAVMFGIVILFIANLHF